MINTFVRIEKAVFPDKSVTEYLNDVVSERFGIKGVPDGVWYWPVQMGGMEVRNPLVPLFCMREKLFSSASLILQASLDKDEAQYTHHKELFTQRNGRLSVDYYKGYRKFGDTFMPMEEFMKYREERSINLGNTYCKLLTVPEEYEIEETKEITAWLDKMQGNDRSSRSSSGITKSLKSMKPYWKWILAVYGSQIHEKYGSVQIVDAAQVPLGVVSVMKARKVRWLG
jgi:hypothetical protein